jgi:hypothetical protein
VPPGWVPLALRGAAGFVLGALMVVFLPPLGLAFALVLAGLLAWVRLRGDEAGALTPLAAGYLLAVTCYLVLVVASAA